MAHIKIDIPNGIFEAEGDEQFIRELYRDYLSEKTALSLTKATTKKSPHHLANSSQLKESYRIIKDINLSFDRLTLKQFYQEKNPNSALERNTLFVYFLDKISKTDNIDLNHIYTCYKEAGIKPPDKLRQSLADTASKKGWLDTKSMSDIKITLKGESYIEHELGN